MTYACPPGSITANLGVLRGTGSYMGNGASQSIVIGFQPVYIHIVNTTAAPASRRGGFKANLFAGNNMIQHDGSASTGITITSTGFAVDASNLVNYSGNLYAFFAFS